MIRADSDVSFGIAPPEYRLPAATLLGPVTLQVSSLDRSAVYYHDVIGLDILHRDDSVAALGVAADGEVLIELQERAGIKAVPSHGRLGLYHVAIVLPDRASLGRFLSHLEARREPIGMSDHFVSEAVYLTDPDGLGLEVYADRAHTAWRVTNRQLEMGSVALNVRAVLAAAQNASWTGAPRGTRIGHIHLHVGNIAAAAAFYHETLGFDKTVWEYPGALFLSAGGYHHHLGTNTWLPNAIAAPENEARLVVWTIVVPTEADVRAVAASCERRGVSVQPQLPSPFQPPFQSQPQLPALTADQKMTQEVTAVRIPDPWGTVVCVRTGKTHNG